MHTADEQTNLRAQLFALIQHHFAGDNSWAAEILSQVPGKRVSHRSIQAWLIAPDKASSRTCPPWAVAKLKDHVVNPENQRLLEMGVRVRNSERGPLADAAKLESQQTVAPCHIAAGT